MSEDLGVPCELGSWFQLFQDKYEIRTYLQAYEIVYLKCIYNQHTTHIFYENKSVENLEAILLIVSEYEIPTKAP